MAVDTLHVHRHKGTDVSLSTGSQNVELFGVSRISACGPEKPRANLIVVKAMARSITRLCSRERVAAKNPNEAQHSASTRFDIYM